MRCAGLAQTFCVGRAGPPVQKRRQGLQDLTGCKVDLVKEDPFAALERLQNLAVLPLKDALAVAHTRHDAAKELCNGGTG